MNFNPEKSGIFLEITFVGCGTTPLNGSYPVKGILGVRLNGPYLEILSESEELTSGGNAFGLTGTERLEDAVTEMGAEVAE